MPKDRDETALEQVNITLPPETVRLLDSLRDGSFRTRSAIINRLIEKAAAERGLVEVPL